ncbi:MAG: hypothetical protein HN524_10875 [Verrucomicrobia bacterium]|nr:hypothetical protein [Verrucomicrobiota bacterium]MBT5619618.1 hypothetical protein [Verrucomicrobiota bacterium]MBT6789128.1 hypothetical protein [Verrucomicrobiota bacterium]
MERKTWLPLVLMLVFAASRWPGMLPQNFSAAHALLFCAAFWLPGWMGWVLPLATIIVTDILLNLFHYSMPVMVPELVVNWMILALFVVLAKWLAGRRSIGRVFLGTLIGALLFYLVSNTVSWMVNPAYAKTIVGWVQALTVGLPGFPPTWLFGLKSLLGTGLFTGLFAGAMKWSEAIDDAPEPETDDEEETEAPPEPSLEAA